jgi:hypothetical protein
VKRQLYYTSKSVSLNRGEKTPLITSLSVRSQEWSVAGKTQ